MGWRRLMHQEPDSESGPVGDPGPFSRRLDDVLSVTRAVEEADPDEVEARIRNISHGVGHD